MVLLDLRHRAELCMPDCGAALELFDMRSRAPLPYRDWREPSAIHVAMSLQVDCNLKSGM